VAQRFLWIAGSVMLVDEVFYSVSAVSGPVAVIGLASVCSAKLQQAGLGTLVATLFSLFVLRDAPATPTLAAGASLVIGAIAVSARSDE
jgi:hypothetical protein